MSGSNKEPATVEDLVKPIEAEAGREIQFCPIRQLPILPSLRVRTLPGFHLLSLDAGKEALARGFYTVFGEKFPCRNLEYLHADDKVFICAEDNKAFLNEMSMRYHRYIGHELKERKAERKRLRERAEERKVRSAAHQAQLQQQQQARQPPRGILRRPEQQQQPVQQEALQPASPPVAQQQQEPEPLEVLGGGGAASKTSPQLAATDDPYKATDDPYAMPAEDPYQVDAASSAGAAIGASEAAENQPAVETDADVGRLAAAAAAATRRPVDKAPAAVEPPQRVVASPAVAPVAAAVSAPTPVAPPPSVASVPATAPAIVAAASAQDLYGDIGERDSKRQKSSSVYATAIGSMLDDNFDEDD